MADLKVAFVDDWVFLDDRVVGNGIRGLNNGIHKT